MPTPITVSIINHKGGVNKTTANLHIGAGLAKLGKRVLVVDLDTQMNLTHSLIGDLPEDEPCVSDVMIKNQIPLHNIIRPTSVPNMDIAPSSESMVDLEINLHAAINREHRLKIALAHPELKKYDFIIIDNGPHIGNAALNSLMASQFYLVPVSAEYLPLVGLTHLTRTIAQIKPFNPTLQNIGYLLTMVDRREGISSEIEAVLRETFKDEVFANIVRINTKFKACPQKRQTIFDIEGPTGKGYTDYLNVSKEFLERVEKAHAKN